MSELNHTTTVWVCRDCHMAHASTGDYSAGQMNLLREDYSLTMGRLDHDNNCNEQMLEDGCVCWVEEFSSNDCEGCGDTLASDRYAYTAWEK